jgi:hypothetical protein
MGKNYVKIIAFLLSLSIFTSLCSGCTFGPNGSAEVTPMEKEESLAVSFDFLGGKDVMPIGGFYAPYNRDFSFDGNQVQNLYSEEIFQLIAEAGVNILTSSADTYSGNGEVVHLALQLGEKYGIGTMVTDGRIGQNVTVEEARKYISDYYDYASFCGMRITDEPSDNNFVLGSESNDIQSWANMGQVFSELGLNVYLNAHPTYKTDEETLKKYRSYIKEMIESCEPNILMWDNYPFTKDGMRTTAYFANMDICREYSLEYGIPFWTFIQAGGQFNDAKEYFDSDPYFPTEAQFNWNVNTCLAFGAQGIQYFPLIQPLHFAYAKTEEYDFNRNGILGAWGNKTPWFYYSKNITAHIRAIDEVLMNSVNKGIIVSGEDAVSDTELVSCILESGSFQELMSVDGDAFVGCFNYNGKTALYVVNYSMEYAQYITLHFNEAQNIRMIQNCETSYVNAKNLTLDMAAGEGVLLVIE